MSSLWTPEGEHRVTRQSAETAGAGTPSPPGEAPATDFAGDEEEAAMAARLQELRGQLVATPVEVVVANHAYGLFELAAIHLSDQPPRLDQACLAIDALGSLVEGLQGRLGEAEPSLVEALAQLRLAFVQIQASAPPDSEISPSSPDHAPR